MSALQLYTPPKAQFDKDDPHFHTLAGPNTRAEYARMGPRDTIESKDWILAKTGGRDAARCIPAAHSASGAIVDGHARATKPDDGWRAIKEAEAGHQLRDRSACVQRRIWPAA